MFFWKCLGMEFLGNQEDVVHRLIVEFLGRLRDNDLRLDGVEVVSDSSTNSLPIREGMDDYSDA